MPQLTFAALAAALALALLRRGVRAAGGDALALGWLGVADDALLAILLRPAALGALRGGRPWLGLAGAPGGRQVAAEQHDPDRGDPERLDQWQRHQRQDDQHRRD